MVANYAKLVSLTSPPITEHSFTLCAGFAWLFGGLISQRLRDWTGGTTYFFISFFLSLPGPPVWCREAVTFHVSPGEEKEIKREKKFKRQATLLLFLFLGPSDSA